MLNLNRGTIDTKEFLVKSVFFELYQILLTALPDGSFTDENKQLLDDLCNICTVFNIDGIAKTTPTTLAVPLVTVYRWSLRKKDCRPCQLMLPSPSNTYGLHVQQLCEDLSFYLAGWDQSGEYLSHVYSKTCAVRQDVFAFLEHCASTMAADVYSETTDGKLNAIDKLLALYVEDRYPVENLIHFEDLIYSLNGASDALPDGDEPHEVLVLTGIQPDEEVLSIRYKAPLDKITCITTCGCLIKEREYNIPTDGDAFWKFINECITSHVARLKHLKILTGICDKLKALIASGETGLEDILLGVEHMLANKSYDARKVCTKGSVLSIDIDPTLSDTTMRVTYRSPDHSLEMRLSGGLPYVLHPGKLSKFMSNCLNH